MLFESLGLYESVQNCAMARAVVKLFARSFSGKLEKGLFEVQTRISFVGAQ
jgi:hypothetical protein